MDGKMLVHELVPLVPESEMYYHASDHTPASGIAKFTREIGGTAFAGPAHPLVCANITSFPSGDCSSPSVAIEPCRSIAATRSIGGAGH